MTNDRTTSRRDVGAPPHRMIGGDARRSARALDRWARAEHHRGPRDVARAGHRAPQRRNDLPRDASRVATRRGAAPRPAPLRVRVPEGEADGLPTLAPSCRWRPTARSAGEGAADLLTPKRDAPAIARRTQGLCPRALGRIESTS
ncbi:MAG: hypothetical protein RLZZ383_835 [Pseudomonadota bacterium]|jgi:hypothetical protein